MTSFAGTATTSSAAPDGMVSITGGDYITIDGIDLAEASGNTTVTTVMEYGYGLFVASVTDGAQNNTIKNCNITLNKVQNTAWTVGHNGSEAIAMHHTTPLAATTSVTPNSAAGTHSSNKFYTNSIANCNAGIVFVGYAAPSPYTLGDANNDIGGSSLATGNSILNFGGGAATNSATGIFVSNQWGVNVSYNTINNNNGLGSNHATTLRGIFLNTGSIAASATCNNNTVTVKGGGTTSTVSCIENSFGGLIPASNMISINNNTISGEYLTATSGAFYGIYNNSSAPTTLNIIGNTIQNIAYSTNALAGSGTLYGIFISGTPTAATAQYVRSNTVNNITRFGTTGATTIGIFSSSSSATLLTNYFRSNTVSNLSIDGTGTSSIIYGIQTSSSIVRCDTNTVFNLSVLKTSGTGALFGIYNISSPTNETYDNNEVYNLSHAGTGITYGIYANTATGVRSIACNKVYSISSNGTTIAGILSASSSPNINSNKIYNIQSNSSGIPTVSGIILSSFGTAGTANIYNNVIGGIYAPNASFTVEAALVRGLNITSTTSSSSVNIYYNTVYLDATSIGTNFSSAALFVAGSTTATTAVVNLRNNILINASTAAGTGYTVAYRRGTGTAGFLANYASTSNNNHFYAGAPSATNLIYYDGTSSAQTMSGYKTGVFTAGTISPRDANSVSEAVSFVSTTGSNSQYLELVNSSAYQAESGGVAIAGYTDSYAGVNVRTGYPLAAQTNGGGAAPDMGAYEGDYTPSDQTGPSITYTNLSNTASTSNRKLSASISDPSGIPTTGANRPTLYWKINSGSWSAVTGTYTSGTTYTFSFGSGVVATDIVSYYIVAQDGASTPNISAYPTIGASGLSSGPPAASTPPSSPSTYVIVSTISGPYTIGGDYAGPSVGNTYATLGEASANATPNQIRAIRTTAAGSGYTSPTVVIGVSWVAATSYNPGDVVGNAGNWYTCSAPGTSAASGGPTGTSSSITDGSVTWAYGGTRATASCVTSGTSPNLQIDGISISGNGSNYSSGTPPVLVITDATGSGATFTVVISGGYELGGAASFELSSTYNSTYEKFPVTFEVIVGASATNTLTIKPGSGITATISGTSSSGLLKLNGTDYVIIDGWYYQ